MSRIEETADKVGHAADSIRDKAAEVSHHLKDVASQKYDEVRHRTSDAIHHGKEKAEAWEQSLETYVQEKPLQAVLLAGGVGLLLGLLWRRH